MNTPWLAVIVPTYNGAKYLRRALESIVVGLNQLIEPRASATGVTDRPRSLTLAARDEKTEIEVIAVDDGSTDDTLNILQEYQSRLPLTIHERRVGNWADNSNYGLQQATALYACFLHQDDLWFPGRLQALHSQLQQTPQVTLLLHACEFIDNEDGPLGPWRCPYPGNRLLSPSLAVERLLVQNFVGMPGATVHRATALTLGGFDASFWYTADWDLWLKLALAGPTLYLPRKLASFRLHPQSQTADRSRSLADFRRQMEAVQERHAAAWPARTAKVRHQVRTAARAAVEINVALAAAYHGQLISWRPLLASLGHLGPVGLHRLLRDSRLWERAGARFRGGFSRNH